MGGIANRSWVGIDLGAADELVSVESGELLSLLRSEGGKLFFRSRNGRHLVAEDVLHVGEGRSATLRGGLRLLGENGLTRAARASCGAPSRGRQRIGADARLVSRGG